MERRNKPSKFVSVFVKITGLVAALIFFKPSVKYTDKKERRMRLSGPLILMSNHKSLLDFALYYMIFPFNSLRFLIAEVMYNKGKAFAWFLNALGGIKVDRDSFDFGFISDSVEVLDNGGILGVFPEGQLPRGGKMSPFKPSLVIIALKTHAPILPVYTNGSYGLFKRARVIIGEKIILNDYTDTDSPSGNEIARLNDILLAKILELKASEEKAA